MTAHPEKALKLQNLVSERLYHEDNLLTQRTYNFLTFNVFLGALLVLANGADSMLPSNVTLVVSLLGISISTFQIAFGRRMERAILFWREYLKLIETDTGWYLDHLLFNFYKSGHAKTSWGEIVAGGANRKPMYTTFPWSFMPSTNTMVGVLFPWIVFCLWVATFGYYCMSISSLFGVFVIAIIFFFVSAFTWFVNVPSKPITISS